MGTPVTNLSSDVREASKDITWSIIAITTSCFSLKDSTEKFCAILTKCGMLPKHDLLLVVETPSQSMHSERIEHDILLNAVVNALMVAFEVASAKRGFTTINTELVNESRMLILDLDVNCSLMEISPFLPLPYETSFVPPSLHAFPHLPSVFTNALWMATFLATKSQKGLWVLTVNSVICYTPLNIPCTESLNDSGATLFTIQKSSKELNSSDKYMILGDSNVVQHIQHSISASKDVKYFDCFTGITYISCNLMNTLLNLHLLSPLNNCTYYGIDSGGEPLRASFCSDLLSAMCSRRDISDTTLHGISKATAMPDQAKEVLWEQVKGYQNYSYSLNIENDNFITLDQSTSKVMDLLLSKFNEIKAFNSVVKVNGSVFINCDISDANIQCRDCLFINCKITGTEKLSGNKCFVYGLHFNVEDSQIDFGVGLMWQTLPLKHRKESLICLGIDDKLFQDYSVSSSSVFNNCWNVLFHGLSISKSKLWKEDSKKSLANAKLFPLPFKPGKKSSQCILKNTIKSFSTFTHNQHLSEELVVNFSTEDLVSYVHLKKILDVGCFLERQDQMYVAQIIKYLNHKNQSTVLSESLVPAFNYFSAFSSSTYCTQLLQLLHSLLQCSTSECSARLLAAAADLLGSMAGTEGGLRSGPAANVMWQNPLILFKRGNFKLGAEKMNHELAKLLSGDQNAADLQCIKQVIAKPLHLMRAARHYERASHIMIGKQVETANLECHGLLSVFQFAFTNALQLYPPMEEWVEATCPARLDLAGGWSDTPPVCYEQGGAVTNIAIKVNGEHPLRARIQLIKECVVRCYIKDKTGTHTALIWSCLADMLGYDNPVSPGALVKAVLVYVNFLDLASTQSLEKQLKNRYGGGIIIEMTSMLPQGSGLGGSSLLAGTLLGALLVWKSGEAPSPHALVHATLGVEQVLTSGGGWQDQVGGLVGGVKLGFSGKGTPLKVTTYVVRLDQALVQEINKRLILVNTGKVRLARNLLQTVLRNWYARDDNLTVGFERLRHLALEMADAFITRNLSMIGNCINRYWFLKKQVASGCEPAKVQQILQAMSPCIDGASLAGAGGGGYLYAFAKKDLKYEAQNIIRNLKGIIADSVIIDEAEVDLDGLCISKGEHRIVVGGSAASFSVLTRSALDRIKGQIERENNLNRV